MEKYCNELVDNMKDCLLFCRSNSHIHQFSDFDKSNTSHLFYPNKCENVIRFEERLKHNKINIVYDKPFIHLDKPYKFSYDVFDKKILIEVGEPTVKATEGGRQ